MSATESARGLRLSVVHPEKSARTQWCRALQARLPGAQVSAWMAPRKGGADAASAENLTPPGFTHFGIGWQPPASFFAQHPDLAAFFTAGAGVDHLLAMEGLPALLPLIRLEDAGMADQMYLYCLHEILRRLSHAQAYEAQQRAGRWQPLAATSPAECRVGVLGLGALGGELARRLSGFGFPVSGFARSPHQIAGVTCLHGAAQWPQFLAGCDVLVLMAPLTAGTRRLVDARALALLPPGAWLINVARGELVDEEALLQALSTGNLAGASLDVFAREPLPSDHPFWQHPRVRLTPHVAAQTLIGPSASQVADKILRLQQGESVSGIVNRQRGY